MVAPQPLLPHVSFLGLARGIQSARELSVGIEQACEE